MTASMIAPAIRTPRRYEPGPAGGVGRPLRQPAALRRAARPLSPTLASSVGDRRRSRTRFRSGVASFAVDHGRDRRGAEVAESTSVTGYYRTFRGWSAKEPSHQPMQTAVALTGTTWSSAATGRSGPLGSGGAGSVWLARDEDAGRDVALKVVERDGQGRRARQTGGRRGDPPPASALPAGACVPPRRRPRLRRLPVRARAEPSRGAPRRQGRRLRRAIEVAAQVLDALAHAHAKGIVHRDVKPANVMVEEGDEVSTRLLDFGLARLDELDGLTATGDVPGTLAYVAPERLEGQPAGGAADVWARGSHALGGSRRLASVWATSPVETARRIAAGAPRLAAARPDLPRELCRDGRPMLSVEPRAPPTRQAARPTFGPVASFECTDAARGRPLRTVLARARAHALLAALAAGGATTLLCLSSPSGWPLPARRRWPVLRRSRPVAGLAVALAAPVLPLGNLSLGLAIAYGALAFAWLPCSPGMPRRSLLFRSAALALAPFGHSAPPSGRSSKPGGRIRRAASAPPPVSRRGRSLVLGRPPFRSPETPGPTAPASAARPARWTCRSRSTAPSRAHRRLAATSCSRARGRVRRPRCLPRPLGNRRLGRRPPRRRCSSCPQHSAVRPRPLSTPLFVCGCGLPSRMRGHRSPDRLAAGRMARAGERPT